MSTGSEDRVMYFRCVETGKPFYVLFHRYSPQHRFQIVKISAEMKPNTQDKEEAIEPKPLQPTGIEPIDAVLNSTEVKQLKTLFTGIVRSITGGPKEHPVFPGYEVSEGDFAISEFDFSGWYCPCCGHAQHGAVPSLFVQCGRCKEYVCGARVRNLGRGKSVFSCHDKCGGGGKLEGEMTSYVGASISPQKQQLQAGKKRELKPPKPRSLPPKRL